MKKAASINFKKKAAMIRKGQNEERKSQMSDEWGRNSLRDADQANATNRSMLQKGNQDPIKEHDGESFKSFETLSNEDARELESDDESSNDDS